MQASFAKLQSQITALNAQLSDMINLNKSVDPSGFNRLAKAAEANSRVFRDAAASTGLFETQQVRVNSATDEYVKKLQAQKMSFREMRAQQKVATAAYREQLAMEKMMVRKNPASSMHGKDTFDVIYPKAYEQAVDSAGNRMRWFNAQLKSGATQMVNWGKNTQWAGRQLMIGFSMPIAAAGAAAAVMSYQVDKEFTRIAKVYDTHADRLQDSAAWEAETAQLRADGYKTGIMAAKEYGAAITDTLKVQAELAATGKTGVELQKSTAEVMRISTLGELDMNTATEATIALQSIFKMSNVELAESFNLINATENATSLQTQDFATAIPIAAATVKAFGGDVEELGILMTAMKERGIGAAEGANALKATMQRLGRPSKQVREEFQQMTGESITELVDSSSNLTEIFTKLNHITKDMKGSEKRDVFAGLFGSYQVTRLMGLTEGMGDLEKGVGQVSEAARVAGMDVEDLAKIADGEMKAMQESLSGRFKRALEELKATAAVIGEPFLEAGVTILETINKIAQGILDMPDFAKKILGWVTVIGLVAGPLIMLTGLFANLGGQGLKTFAAAITMFGRMNGSMTIADKQTRIYSAAAKMAENQHLSNTKAVTSLTATMDKLVAAQQAANTASLKEAASQGQVLKMSKALKIAEDERLRQMQIKNRLMQQYAISDVGQTRFIDANGNQSNYGAALASATSDVDKTNAAHIAASAEEEKKARQGTAVAAVATQRSMDRQRVAAVGTAAAGAAMTASMAAMMLPLGEAGNQFAKWTMIGTLIVPAAWTLSGIIGKLVLSSGQYSKNMWSAAAATRAGSASAGGSLLAGLGSMASKANVVGLAVGAIAFGAYKVWDHFRDIRVEQERIDKANANLISQTERWAAATGKTLEGYKRLDTAMRTGADTADMAKRVEFYQSDEERKNTDEFDNMDDMKQSTILAAKYHDMVVGMGMSHKEAQKEIQAFLMATGQSFTVAEVNARRFANTLSVVDRNGKRVAKASTAKEFADEFGKSIAAINKVAGEMDYLDPMGDFEKNRKFLTQVGQQGGQMYSQAFMDGTKDERAALQKSLVDQVTAPWDDIASKADSIDRENLKNVWGLDDASVNEMLADGEKLRAFYMKMDSDDRQNFQATFGFPEAIQKAEALERVIVDGIADSLGVAGDGVDTLGELFRDASIMAKTLDDRVGSIGMNALGGVSILKSGLEVAISDVNTMYEQMVGEAFDPKDRKAFEALLTDVQSVTDAEYEDMSEEKKAAHDQRKQQLQELITLLYAAAKAEGILLGDTDFETMQNLFNGIKDPAAGAENAVKKLGNEMNNLNDVNVKVNIDVVGEAFQAGREGIQQDMADMLTEDFDAGMEADKTRVSNYWDNQKESLDAEMERRSAGLDAKWEKRKDGAEKYWDARIDAVNNAIEAEEKAEEKRQKIFEAEMERIERLSNARNLNIDFNVALNEGNLDEAAKIANDQQAEATKFALQDAADASGEVSEKRVDTLGNKAEDLEAQKDAAMKAMDAREKAEKAHLDKVSDMRKKAMDKDAEAAIAANEEEWETKKENFDNQMELFLAFTARNDKELKKHMEDVGISYDDFGAALKARGTDWSTFMGDTMKEHVRLAALKLRDDSVWNELGQSGIDGMLKGMGFTGKNQFRHFVKTGEMADVREDNPDVPEKARSTNGAVDSKTGANNPAKPQVNKVGGAHRGGWAGKTGNDRSGVAKNLKGLHPNELMIRAQHGEFIVNRKAAAKNPKILESINNGDKIGVDGYGTGGGGYAPLAGLMAGGVMRGMMMGVQKHMIKKARKGRKAARREAAMGGGEGFNAQGYMPGQGGWSRPSTPGLGWSNTHDYRAPTGTPIYAISDGTITDSRAITSGGSPGNGSVTPGGVPYRSYGETIGMRDATGNIFRYAHLSARYVGAGKSVKGGALLGRTGNTGNSTGSHLHMDVNGDYNASGYLASRGIPLKEGAARIKVDNLPSVLHKNEGVLTEGLNKKFHEGVDRFAKGASVVYDIDINGEGLETKEIVREVIKEINKNDARKTQSRTVGRRP